MLEKKLPLASMLEIIAKTPMSASHEKIREVSREIQRNADQSILDEWVTECEELNTVFEMTYKADIRGIKLWKESHPDKKLTIPSQEHLICWLIEQYDLALSRAEKAEEQILDGLTREAELRAKVPTLIDKMDNKEFLDLPIEVRRYILALQSEIVSLKAQVAEKEQEWQGLKQMYQEALEGKFEAECLAGDLSDKLAEAEKQISDAEFFMGAGNPDAYFILHPRFAR